MLEKGFEVVDIEPVLDDCEASGFINDKRYAELLVRSHITRGHGPIRIRQAIAQKGLSKDCIEAALSANDHDWFELAKAKAIKKYVTPKVTEVKGSQSRELVAKEKAKRVRFLLSQGFNYEQVSYALDYDPLADDDD
ncbi:recombination regulator RecX [Shewanella decolorationis]|uniref:Regulatory protein RecX n=1 Tax=Shewanella decolorationis TaxID=256839 RepID=A0A5B8QWA4_9GAMM|nr:regulatory protein RecX [Shewanella decolorationis]QDZ90196.1 recombination regulator RecX [Shewanella decolorationis]